MTPGGGGVVSTAWTWQTDRVVRFLQLCQSDFHRQPRHSSRGQSRSCCRAHPEIVSAYRACSGCAAPRRRPKWTPTCDWGRVSFAPRRRPSRLKSGRVSPLLAPVTQRWRTAISGTLGRHSWTASASQLVPAGSSVVTPTPWTVGTPSSAIARALFPSAFLRNDGHPAILRSRQVQTSTREKLGSATPCARV